MHAIVAVFTVWFCLLSIGQLSLLSNVESEAVRPVGKAQSPGGFELAVADTVESSDSLLARLSAAMKEVKQVPLSKTGTFPKNPVGVKPANIKPAKIKPASPGPVIAKRITRRPVSRKLESAASTASILDGITRRKVKFHPYNKLVRPSKEQLRKAKPVRQIEVATSLPLPIVAVPKASNPVLEDVFVSRKGDETRIDLQFSSETEYSILYVKEKNLLRVKLTDVPEKSLKATFPPLIVLSSVKYSRDNDGKGTNVALTLASNVEPGKLSRTSAGKTSRLRLSFISKVSTCVSADGSKFIAADQKWLGEGLQYMKYRYQPRIGVGTDVHILRYDLASKEYGIGLKLAQDKILGKARLSEMVKTSKHVAAVNASFFSGSGEPLGLLSSNREVLSVPVSKRACFGIFNGERALLGNPGFTGKVITAKGEFALEGINQTGNGAKGKMLVYTPEFGSSTKTVGSGLELAIADGRIVAVQENDTPVPPNGFVVGVRGEPTPEMSETKFWDKVKFKWGLTPPWDVADFAIGGGPMLLEDGEDKITWKAEKFSKAFAVTPAPRTAVGIGADGDIFLVVADGRDKERNRGLSLSDLAKVMRRAGCKSAINLDGGGSTTMWIDGKVVNRPSDGRERKISSAIVITRQLQAMYADSGLNNGLIRGI